MNRNDTQFLRAIAILLILNSHTDELLPVTFLASGGAIGNSIFFMLSAFGIYLSRQKNRRKNFKEWISDRMMRIYPSLWVVLILVFMPFALKNGELTQATFLSFIGNLFWPPFWFIKWLIVCYLVAYPLIAGSPARETRKFSAALALLACIYAWAYLTRIDLSRFSVETVPFKLIFYLALFIVGFFIAKSNAEIRYAGLGDYGILALSLCLLYGHKFLMTRGYCLKFQFIEQLCLVPLAFSLLKISRSPLILHTVMQNRVLSPVVHFTADHTLELYLLHAGILSVVVAERVTFPMNIVLFYGVTFGLTALVKRAADACRAVMAREDRAEAAGNA